MDLAVEIVDPSDNVTGLRFLVQLKATDTTDITRALKVRLRKDTIRYYRDLTLPVLIALYHAPTNTIYARWADDLALSAERRSVSSRAHEKKDAETITLQLDRESLWRDSSPDTIAQDVRQWRLMRQPTLALPLLITLRVAPSPVFPFTAEEIVTAAAMLPPPATSIVRFSELDKPGRIATVAIDTSSVTIDFGVGIRTTVEISGVGIAGYPRVVVASDLMMFVSIALGSAGHHDLAAEIVAIFATHSSLLTDLRVSHFAAAALVRTGKMVDAVRIAECCDLAPETREAAEVFLARVLVHADRLDAATIADVTKALERWLARAEANSDARALAAAHYNLGRFLGWQRGRDLESVRHIHRAIIVDPAYGTRWYLWRELGVLAFRRGWYRRARVWYTRALELGGDAECEALLADTLVHCGSYAAAASAFNRYLEREQHPAEYWRLKAILLPHLVDYVGTDLTSPSDSACIEGIKEAAAQPDNAEQIFRTALRKSGICQVIWWNLAQLSLRNRQVLEAFRLFLLTALYSPSDGEAWSNAIILSTQVEKDAQAVAALLPLIVRAGLQTVGESLYTLLAAKLAHDVPSERREQILSLLRSLFASVPERAVKREVRITHPGGFYVVSLDQQESGREKDGEA